MNVRGALEAARTFVKDDNGDVHFTLSLLLESTTNFCTWLRLRPRCVAFGVVLPPFFRLPLTAPSQPHSSHSHPSPSQGILDQVAVSRVDFE